MTAPAPASVGAARSGAVEGLRAVAATLVVAFHLHRALITTHPGFVVGTTGLLVDRLGPFGVSIFFVLSGFLLYRPYATATLDGRAFPRVGPYYLRRFVRIFPAYWVALIVLVLTVSYPIVTNGVDGITYFGLLQNYRVGYELRGLGVAWTLVIEVSFYLVLPLLARALRSPDASARSRLTRQLVGIALLVAVGVAVRVWAIWYKGPTTLAGGVFAPWRAPNAWLPGYVDWFALGMLLAVTAAWHAHGGRVPRPVDWLARHDVPSWVVGLGAYAVVALTATFPPPGVSNPPVTQLLVTTVFPIAGFFVVLPVALAPDGAGLRRGLRSAPLVAIGAISYGIYLWHLTVIRWTQDWIAAGTIPRSAALQAVLVIGITMVVATLSYLLVERPLMRWSVRWSRRPERLVVRS